MFPLLSLRLRPLRRCPCRCGRRSRCCGRGPKQLQLQSLLVLLVSRRRRRSCWRCRSGPRLLRLSQLPLRLLLLPLPRRLLLPLPRRLLPLRLQPLRLLPAQRLALLLLRLLLLLRPLLQLLPLALLSASSWLRCQLPQDPGAAGKRDRSGKAAQR